MEENTIMTLTEILAIPESINLLDYENLLKKSRSWKGKSGKQIILFLQRKTV